MARITVEDCLEKVDNQYDLVLLAKERTAQLNSGAEMLVPEDNDKKTIISLREIGDGKININDLEKSAILRLRKEPDESLEQEEFKIAGAVVLITVCLSFIMLPLIIKKRKRLKRVVDARNRQRLTDSMADEFDDFFD